MIIRTARRWTDALAKTPIVNNCRRRETQSELPPHFGSYARARPDARRLHAPDHPTTSHPAPSDDGAPVHAGRLGAVMRDAAVAVVRRRAAFGETRRQPSRGVGGDAQARVRLFEDEEEARYWKQVAINAGGRRVKGVYDELP